MQIPRIFYAGELNEQHSYTLAEDESHHLRTVLRAKTGDLIELFNNTNYIYLANIQQLSKKAIIVYIQSSKYANRESNLQLHLGQVITKGERMEFTIQKAVELGVNTITPLISTRSVVKLNTERLDKKIQQWQKIIIGACKQSGRNQVPEIKPITNLQDWLIGSTNSLNLLLNPANGISIKQLAIQAKQEIRLLIGPEGGLTADEINLANQAKFINLQLGPRILRTESASLVALSLLQGLYGDLA